MILYRPVGQKEKELDKLKLEIEEVKKKELVILENLSGLSADEASNLAKGFEYITSPSGKYAVILA